MGKLPDLTDQEWQDLHKRLTLYASAKAKKLVWRGLPGGTNQAMPGGHGPDSLASEAIVSVLNEERACSATNAGELLKSLMDVVDSKVSHLVESAENRKGKRLPSANGNTRDSFDDVQGAGAKADHPLVQVADDEAARVFRDKVRTALDGEEKLLELFECLEAGCTGRADIAVLLGASESEVTNLKKRLARKLEPLLGESRKATHGRAGTIR